MWFRLGLVVLLYSFGVYSYNSDYERCKVYRFYPNNLWQRNYLHSHFSKSKDCDFWSLTKDEGAAVVAMVHPPQQREFESMLKRMGVYFNVTVSNVAEVMNEDKQKLRANLLDFTSYPDFDDINEYLERLAVWYKGRVFVKTFGKSSEGREIKALWISNGVVRPGKQVIFVDAGIHAREWIAPPVALYIIHQLADNPKANKDLLKNFDWVILPVVNPDGYEYSRKYDQLWRKTRSNISNKTCVGVDGNRNFNFHWSDVGSSFSKCEEDYHGPYAFSEPETRIVRNIMRRVRRICKMYLTLHSFGSYLLYPWGWTTYSARNKKAMHRVATAGARAIYASTRRKYKVGSAAQVLYRASGGSDDYAYGVMKIPVAITMELPEGGSGFDPPASDILRIVEETWIGIKAMARELDYVYNG